MLVVLAAVEHQHHVRMRQARRRPRFLLEALAHGRLRREVGAQEFHRDVAPETQVHGAMHVAHTAATDQLTDLVPLVQNFVGPQRVHHSRVFPVFGRNKPRQVIAADLEKDDRMDRRSFIRTAALGTAGAVALGPDFWKAAFAVQPVPGFIYGELQPPDANGIMLPLGFTSQLLATSLQPVGTTGYVWHGAPDGGAVFSTSDGGWIYTSNSEIPGIGGVGALRFDAAGNVVGAHRVITGTSVNCAGGPTPWGTWLTCEEHEGGFVFECNPAGLNEYATSRRAGLGTFSHEAAAVDPIRKHVYLSEDETDGCLYRFTAKRWPDLNEGRLEAAVLTPAVGSTTANPLWDVTWRRIPNPNILPGTKFTRQQVPATTKFNGGEGLWYDSDRIYFTTKGDNRVWMLNVVTSKMELIYDRAQAGPDPLLHGVDNIIVNTAGEIFVAEDGGNMEINVISPGPAPRIEPLLRIVGQPASEITGPAFSPDFQHLYFSSQRGGQSVNVPEVGNIGVGLTYVVSGPFHAGTNVPAVADSGIVSGLVHEAVEPPVRGIDPGLGDVVHSVDRTIAGLGL